MIKLVPMKIKHFIFTMLLILGLQVVVGCGKKENANLQEYENSAKQLCDKLISCVVEPMKGQAMAMNVEVDAFKKQCEKSIIKALQENKIPQFKPCVDAISNATCEQIQKNQIEACTSINQLILTQP
jgi:hypothetical protein